MGISKNSVQWLRAATLVAGVVGLGVLTGCDVKSFIDPSELGRYEHEPLARPILSTIDPGIEKGNDDFASATEPTPDDLKDVTGDYTISRNDMLSIEIGDLNGPGVPTLKQARVSESGNISLPFIGSLHAEGLTEIELEQAVVDAYRHANILQNAQVSVQLVEARGRAFSILGAVGQPGEYAIVASDFRVLNALVLARDTTSPLVEYLYVIRRSELPRNSTPAAGSKSSATPTTGPTPQDLAPKSEANHRSPALASARATRVLNLADVAPASEPAGVTSTATAPATAPDTAPASPVAVTSPAPAEVATSKPFEFSEPTMPGSPRIIKIPIIPLRNGDLRYNITIRPHDLIVVQNLDVGEYYLGGHVARPGVYSLTGRRITLKQGIISGGMLDALAIPQRTDIIRRIGANQEVFVRIDLDKIFSGQQSDIYLKPNDEVMVGTNLLAPFIAAVRGGFRITYGFGFLYDRNFNTSNDNSSF